MNKFELVENAVSRMFILRDRENGKLVVFVDGRISLECGVNPSMWIKKSNTVYVDGQEFWLDIESISHHDYFNVTATLKYQYPNRNVSWSTMKNINVY